MGAPKGNLNASKSGTFGDALRKVIAQDDGKRLRAAAEKLLDLASEGTPWAVKELFDRTDGKAFQAIQLSGDQDNPFVISVIERVIVDPKTPDTNS